MADYGINIGVNIKGEQRLNQVKSTLGQINQLASSLKPINLLAPGGGKLGDEIRKAMKPLRDFAREAQNANQTYSNTLAGATGQARTFETVLKNVKIAAGGYSKQTSEVKGFANALAQATAQAQRLERNLENLKRDAFQQEGLPIGPATQLGTLEADLARLDFQRQQRNERSRAARNARLNRRRRFTDIATGAGFPLLFGGGPLQALGGGIGGAFGGLGGAIAGSAIIAQIEGFATAAAQTGQAVNSVTGALELAREQSLFSTDAEKERAAVLEEQGRVSELATLLTQQFADKIGNEGLKSLQDLGDETDKTAKLWGTLTLQLQTLIAGPLTEFLKLVNSFLGGITTEQRFKAFQRDIAGDPAALARFKEIEAEVVGGRFKNVRGGGTEFVPGIRTVAKQEEIMRRATAAGLRPATNKIVPTGGDLRALTGTTRGKTQAEKDEEALQRLLIRGEKERERLLARQVKIKGDMILSLSDELALVRAQGNGTEKQVRQQQRIEELVRKTGDEGMRPIIEKYVKMIDAQRELNDEAEKMSELFQEIGASIKDGVVESISAAVDGTRSLAEVASNMLSRIANQLLDIGVNLALFGVPTGFGKKDSGGLLSSILGRANGGAVASGRPYMVGERGPELFVPGAQGNIVPNKAMGGANIVVNVDASETQAQGDQPNAKALGAAIGAAVQAELVRQKRPGGLLSN